MSAKVGRVGKNCRNVLLQCRLGEEDIIITDVTIQSLTLHFLSLKSLEGAE